MQVTVTEPAAAPSRPSSPNIPLALVLGAALGLALGFGVAVLRAVLDTHVHTLHDLEAITDKPILGGIAKDPDAAKRPLIVHADPRSPPIRIVPRPAHQPAISRGRRRATRLRGLELWTGRG